MAVKKDIDCFAKHGRSDLQNEFDNHPEKGKRSDFEIARDIVLGEHKRLHDRLNGIKSQLNETLPDKSKFKIEPYAQQPFPKEKIDEINKNEEKAKREVLRQNVAKEQEQPPEKKGRTPVTLSGNTETERKTLIANRKKETYVPTKITDEQKLLDRVNAFNKTDKRYKRSPEGRSELNNIKVAVDAFNRTHNQKYTALQNRPGDIEFRNAERKKVQRNNKAAGDLSIDETGLPLLQRSDKVHEVFNEVLDRGLFPTGYTVDGRRMNDSQLDGAIQDIMDGIPSRAANNYLDNLEKMIEKDDFDFSTPDIAQQERISLSNILETEKQQQGDLMDEKGIEDYLNEQSNLTPEQEEIVSDNIDNLITQHEQGSIISDTGQVQSTPEEGQGTSDTAAEQDTGVKNENAQVAETAQDKFNAKVDRVADALIDFLTPKVKVDAQKQGLGIPEIVRAGADAIKAAYAISQDIQEAIGKGIDEMRKLWNDAGFADFPEDGLKDVMDKEFAGYATQQNKAGPQQSTQTTQSTEHEFIAKILTTNIDAKRYPTIFENNRTDKQLTAVTQGEGQNRIVDGDYVVALETDLREISIQSAHALENQLGADWALKTLEWLEQNPSNGDMAQVVGVLNIMSNENYQDIEDTHDGNRISKLTKIQKRIDVVTNQRLRSASLGLYQRRLYRKFATGGNMHDILSSAILSPEMAEMQDEFNAILSEEVTDEQINKAQPIKPDTKKSSIRKVTGKAKRNASSSLKDDLKLRAADAANKTGKSVKELIDEANAKIKNIKC